MGILFLMCNLATLAVLIRRRYWALFPLFMAFMVVNCWQIFSRLFVVVEDRSTWMHYWGPGEWPLLAFTAIAISEAVWHSLRRLWPDSRDLAIFGMLALAAIAIWYTWLPRSGDWYAQLLQWRGTIYLGLAVVSWVAWLGGTFWNHKWPRGARLHLAVCAGLMAAHVVPIDWTVWGQSNLQFRLAELLCCTGWLVNSGFLKEEFVQARKAHYAVDRQPVHARPALSRIPRTASRTV